MQVTKPKRQRKRLFQAPDHIRYKQFSARLSPELRASHEAKAIPVRSGDTIRVMRGDYKGFEGKITSVERKRYRIFVEGLRREKVDGTTISVPIHPSKVMITNLNLEDKWRRQILERKKETNKKKIEILTKPPKKEDIQAKEVTEAKSKKSKTKKPEKTKKGKSKQKREKAKKEASEGQKNRKKKTQDRKKGNKAKRDRKG